MTEVIQAELLNPDEDDEGQLPPAPDEVALTILQGLLSSGRFEVDNIHAAVANAWHAVPQFYIMREKYAAEIAPLFFRSVSF